MPLRTTAFAVSKLIPVPLMIDFIEARVFALKRIDFPDFSVDALSGLLVAEPYTLSFFGAGVYIALLADPRGARKNESPGGQPQAGYVQ
jgi:hypothetical protein